jgi:hypothetical protein
MELSADEKPLLDWQGLLLDRPVEKEAVASVLAEALGIPLTAVQVVDDFMDAVPYPEREVLVQRAHVAGEFPFMLEALVSSKTLGDKDGGLVGDAFCARLGCRCLVSLRHPNPFAYCLIDEPGRRTYVLTDSEAEDRELPEFNILRKLSERL